MSTAAGAVAILSLLALGMEPCEDSDGSFLDVVRDRLSHGVRVAHARRACVLLVKVLAWGRPISVSIPMAPVPGPARDRIGTEEEPAPLEGRFGPKS